jgi:hypothetical protein
MEENKTERTMEEVQKEYSLLCAQAGQLQYQIFIHKKDLEITNDKLRKLNFEAAAINAKKEEKSNG